MERCPRCGKFTLENDIFNPGKGRCLHEDCGYTTYKCATSYIPDKEKKGDRKIVDEAIKEQIKEIIKEHDDKIVKIEDEIDQLEVIIGIAETKIEILQEEKESKIKKIFGYKQYGAKCCKNCQHGYDQPICDISVNFIGIEPLGICDYFIMHEEMVEVNENE